MKQNRHLVWLVGIDAPQEGHRSGRLCTRGRTRGDGYEPPSAPRSELAACRGGQTPVGSCTPRRRRGPVRRRVGFFEEILDGHREVGVAAVPPAPSLQDGRSAGGRARQPDRVHRRLRPRGTEADAFGRENVLPDSPAQFQGFPVYCPVVESGLGLLSGRRDDVGMGVTEDARDVVHPEVDVLVAVRIPDASPVGVLDADRMWRCVSDVVRDAAGEDVERRFVEPSALVGTVRKVVSVRHTGVLVVKPLRRSASARCRPSHQCRIGPRPRPGHGGHRRTSPSRRRSGRKPSARRSPR